MKRIEKWWRTLKKKDRRFMSNKVIFTDSKIELRN